MDLHEAAAHGAAEEVNRLLAGGADARARDADGRTALGHAAAGGHADVVRLLLDAGADPDGGAPDAASGAEDEALAGTSETGEDADEDDWAPGRMSTPLLAVCEGEADEPVALEIVRLLLAAGADVDYQDDVGQTPLSLAVANEWAQVVRELLAGGADANRADDEGMTALFHALGTDEDRETVVQIVHALLGAGADIHRRDDEGRTPLMLAAAHGYVGLCRELLEMGADPLASDEDGRTALAHAAETLANLTFDREEGGLTPEEMREAVGQLGIDADSDRGRQMLALMQNRDQPSEFMVQMSGAESVEEFEATRTEGLHWLNEVVDLLVARGSPLESAVPYLARAGRHDLLRTEGLNLDATDPADAFGHTALTAAAAGGKAATVRLLLEAGANPNAASSTLGETALMCAPGTHRGLQCARLLVDAGADPDARDANDLTILERAIDANDPDKVRFLLDAGADPRIGTPLLWAVLREDAELVRLLIERGADPDAPLPADGRVAFSGFFRGTTALMRAAAGESAEILQLLLDAEANVGAVDRQGRTAVDVAMQNGRLRVAELLRRAGAKEADVSGFGAALLPAAESGSVEEVRHCLAQGADPDTRGDRGLTPLVLAAREGHDEVVDLLLGAGADVNACSEPGYSGGNQTPLRCAVVRGHAAIVHRLVVGGADVRPVYQYSSIPSEKRNTIVPSSGSALHDAARVGNREIVAALLEAGADVNAVDSADETPLVASIGMRRWDVAAQLLEAGAARRPRDADFLAALDFPAAAETPEFAESKAQLEQLSGAPAAPSTDVPGLLVLTVTPDGVPPPSGADAESFRREFEFSRRLDEKMWRVLDACYEDCLARGHLVINSGMPFTGSTKRRYVCLLPTCEKFAVLAVVGVRGNEVELSTRDIIDWLRDFEKDHPFRLRGCRFDTVEIELTTAVEDPEATARRLYKFCPDLVQQGFDSMAALARHLASNRRLHLWWD